MRKPFELLGLAVLALWVAGAFGLIDFEVCVKAPGGCRPTAVAGGGTR